jgi:predicted transcriptional regulator
MSKLEDHISEFIKENPGYTIKELCNKMPGNIAVPPGTFKRILHTLVKENKVAVDNAGHFCWIYNPERFDECMSKPELFIK